MHSDQKHCYCVSLSLKVKVKAKIKKQMPSRTINIPPKKQNKQEICPVTGVQPMCQICYDDLLTGQQMSRVIM